MGRGIHKYWLNCTVSFEDISSIIEDTIDKRDINILVLVEKTQKLFPRANTDYKSVESLVAR